ncbi:ThuA domain-containing protein [Pseudarthrobacter sp.]|uniref:ThuA domain-containing protein n=1 Tax=Pseudarthrobacter sp. TaxID=1934409 RepID=UPI002FC7AA65
MTAGRLTEPRALLLTGSGRYADPWHPFAETSAALAALLREAGFGVETADDVDAALAGLVTPGAGAGLPDLLVVNVGLPRDDLPSPGTPEAVAGLRRLLEEGRPLLVSHVSSTSFLDSPEWEAALGGRWIRGTSMHPAYGPAEIHVRRESGPVVEGIADFELPDERYSYLATAPGITIHATHTHEDLEHPVMWSLDRRTGRTFYDALGHDAASYQSPEHREILLRAVTWLTAGQQP